MKYNHNILINITFIIGFTEIAKAGWVLSHSYDDKAMLYVKHGRGLVTLDIDRVEAFLSGKRILCLAGIKNNKKCKEAENLIRCLKKSFFAPPINLKVEYEGLMPQYEERIRAVVKEREGISKEEDDDALDQHGFRSSLNFHLPRHAKTVIEMKESPYLY